MIVERKLIEVLQQQYGGKWVALKGNEVLVSAETFAEVLDLVAGQGIEGPHVFYCPREGEKPKAYLFGASLWT